jgi:Ser/Thr protein kinase RdoA (MazF antagonist)
MSQTFTKRRDPAPPGSIPDRLQMFVREVRFYREIAPVVGVRVPDCLRAEEQDGKTFLEIEDLSSWRAGADPEAAAQTLATLHGRWEDRVLDEFPWASYADLGDLVERLYDETWPSTRKRPDLTSSVLALGDRLVGNVQDADARADSSGPPTLVHGDASYTNMRTSPTGQVALLDWEDFGVGPGCYDLAWLLVSSIDPGDWDRAITAYGGAPRLDEALPAAAVQGLLTLIDSPEGSPGALGWIARLDEVTRRS